MTKEAHAAVADAEKRWGVAFGFIAWLGSVLAPALIFDLDISTTSDAGNMYRAYFQILATVLFLLGLNLIANFGWKTNLMLVLFSLGTFATYTLLRDVWSCAYLDGGRYVIGETLRSTAEEFLKTRELLEASCSDQLLPFGGDSLMIWERQGLVIRFVILFGSFSLAWLSLALLVIGALRLLRDKIK